VHPPPAAYHSAAGRGSTPTRKARGYSSARQHLLVPAAKDADAHPGGPAGW